MPETERQLTSSEIRCIATELMRTVDNVPIFYMVEILEQVMEMRHRQGRTEDVDYMVETSEEEQEEEEEDKTSSEEED
jgi:hypothetical protein|tara:strand:- start:417 stop:650 length:234 start_codon:yes stop_codon:yes gene_type:complete